MSGQKDVAMVVEIEDLIIITHTKIIVLVECKNVMSVIGLPIRIVLTTDLTWP